MCFGQSMVSSSVRLWISTPQPGIVKDDKFLHAPSISLVLAKYAPLLQNCQRLYQASNNIKDKKMLVCFSALHYNKIFCCPDLFLEWESGSCSQNWLRENPFPHCLALYYIFGVDSRRKACMSLFYLFLSAVISTQNPFFSISSFTRSL